MAKRARKKAAPTDVIKFEDRELTKMQIRRWNAYKKMAGDDLGTKQFGEWLKAQPVGGGPIVDERANKILAVLNPLFEKKEISFPRGGYTIRSGRGGLMIERAAKEEE